MYLGRIVGTVWATVKHPAMTGCRMLVVQPLTPELRNTGKQLICTDCTGAGAGELVYWVRGKEASFPFLPAEPPLDNTVVGIVDEVHVKRTPLEVGLDSRSNPASDPGPQALPQTGPLRAVVPPVPSSPAKAPAPVHRKSRKG